MATLEFHDACALFPLMSDEEYCALVVDIHEHGQHEPVLTLDGKIIDGRNRYRACQQLGIEPVVQEWQRNGSVVDFVVSLNLHRRHLTAGQKAALAADLLPWYEREAAEREKAGKKPDPSQNFEQGRAATLAAAKVGANRQYTYEAEALKERATDLFDQLKSGEIGMMDARRELRRREREETLSTAPLEATGKYRVIYADPPWEYGQVIDKYGPADRHYLTMPTEDICALPIPDMAENDAVLFLWSTSPKIEEALQVCKSWGFSYKAMFVWDKIKHNYGHYNSVRHELLLICTRGSCTPDSKELIDSVVAVERSEHSVKPEEFRRIIDQLYPHGQRVELFARGECPDNWKGWGNEYPGD